MSHVAQALQQMLALACKHDTAALVLAKSHVQQEVKAAPAWREGEEERSRMADLKKHLCSQTFDDVLHCSAAFINEHLRQDIADVAPAKRHGNSTSWHTFPCMSEKRGVTDRHTQPSEQRRYDVPRLVHFLWEVGKEWVTTKREWRRKDTQKNAKSPHVDSWSEQRFNVCRQRGIEHNALIRANSLQRARHEQLRGPVPFLVQMVERWFLERRCRRRYHAEIRDAYLEVAI
jgi:hypothetical protein